MDSNVYIDKRVEKIAKKYNVVLPKDRTLSEILTDAGYPSLGLMIDGK